MFDKIKKKNDEPSGAQIHTTTQEGRETNMSTGDTTPPATGSLVPQAPSPTNSRVLQTPDKPSIISEPFTFRGDIEADGTVHIEGKVMGSVTATNIHISQTGKVEGDVRCKYVSVKGHVGGTVICEELVLSSSAVIDGQVTYRYITVARGAQVLCDVHHKP